MEGLGHLRKVMVVDDGELVGQSLKLLLNAVGFAVDLVRSGEEALEHWRPGTYRVVITDFRMQGMQGDQLAAAIKARSPEQPVILVTGFPPDRSPQGVDLVLLKPCSLTTLREAMRQFETGDAVGEAG